MKLLLITVMFLTAFCFASAEEPKPPKLVTYYLGLLYKGSIRTQSPEEAEKIQAAHLQHLESLFKQGVLLIAGPVGDDGDLRGIVILKVNSLEEAQALVNEDPAVKAGRLRVELHAWMSQSLEVLRYKNVESP